MKGIKNIIMILVFSLFLFSVSAMCFFGEEKIYSDSERRELQSFPEVSKESVLSGEFMNNFDLYAADQFPFRHKFQSLKAIFSTKALRKMENNEIFYADGHLSKIDAAENEYMMEYAANLFKKINDTHIKGKNAKVYFSVIPDKNYYLASENGYPSLDYNSFVTKMKSKLDFMEYIDVSDKLSLEDYFTTDTHWKQTHITDVSLKIADAMGKASFDKYDVNVLDIPFKGVYHGQSALNKESDVIKYLTNQTIDNCIVTYYNNGYPEKGDMYNMKKAEGKDPYEMFLSGSVPLVTIENPIVQEKNELIIFRDSFASSLAPLLTKSYSKITLVDLRYMQSSMLESFLNFENCDVLFLYSTALLNNSIAMR